MSSHELEYHITAIVLTLNEEKHLARCLDSLKGVVSKVVVVDCFSKDDTVAIAENYGATVIQHEWVNYATQFNWALSELSQSTEWVLRIDADEVLTPDLAKEIDCRLGHVSDDVAGIYCGRRMTFQGRTIKYGGVFPIRVLRLFKHGHGECENRWMDEHVKVDGSTDEFQGEIVDDNLNSITWWTEKHNKYASREAVDLLNLKFRFMPHDSVAAFSFSNQAGFKRWIKERVYSYLPPGFRAFLYFFYRYVFRLGFLDGQEGTAFHFLQGFWYRYLVDAKVTEVQRYMRENKVGVEIAIDEVLGIKV